MRDLAGIDLISIVYARCIKVRERIEPDRNLVLARFSEESGEENASEAMEAVARLPCFA